MNFKNLTTLYPDHISKFLIFYHVLEIFSKSYEKSISNESIILWPSDIQIKAARINSWWCAQKSKKDFEGTEEKSILLEVISLWDFII